ncbi:MAG: hypothetical protein ACFHHU_03325 [Porticoccaceae bacterium]
MLDEATASVDSVTEQLIQKAMDQVFAEKTVIAIAHRLSTIQHSDQILVLDEGKIAEQGTHRSLLDPGRLIFKPGDHPWINQPLKCQLFAPYRS